MHRLIISSRPYLIGVLCFLLGAAITVLVGLKIAHDASSESVIGYVVTYTNLVEKAAAMPDTDRTLSSWIWGFAQNYAGLAGEQYEDLSPRARETLVESVARIDELAPHFAPDTRPSVYTAKESAAMRHCILSAKVDANANVGSCVRALKPEIFGKSNSAPELTKLSPDSRKSALATPSMDGSHAGQPPT